jgi:hypothetical protein
MPRIVSDIVDTYVIRRLNARVQFMLLQRATDVPMPSTWQAFHIQIDANEPTLAAAVRAVKAYSGLNVSAAFAADYVNQFYDETRDVLVLAPVIAVEVHPQAPVSLGEDYRDVAWLDEQEATARLPFAGQRAAVHRIAEFIGIGEAEADMYRLDISQWAPTTTQSPAAADHISIVAAPDDESDDIR